MKHWVLGLIWLNVGFPSFRSAENIEFLDEGSHMGKWRGGREGCATTFRTCNQKSLIDHALKRKASSLEKNCRHSFWHCGRGTCSCWDEVGISGDLSYWVPPWSNKDLTAINRESGHTCIRQALQRASSMWSNIVYMAMDNVLNSVELSECRWTCWILLSNALEMKLYLRCISIH